MPLFYKVCRTDQKKKKKELDSKQNNSINSQKKKKKTHVKMLFRRHMMAEIMIDIYFKLHYFTLLLLLDFQSKILVKYLIIYGQESQLDIRTSL